MTTISSPQLAQLIQGKARLRSAPRELDSRLPAEHPDQKALDCSTIEGWTQTIDTLLHQAWDNDGVPFNFTHDYAFLKNSPKELPPVTIVWEVISEAPAIMTRSGHRNIKPAVREVVGQEVEQADATPPVVVGSGAGAMIVWAQSIDVTMMFSVYADSWGRMYEYHRKFKDFMKTYTGIFIGTGLQQLYWQQSTRDALYDPPKNEAYPNRTMFYFARLEEQTKAKLSTIETVLILANVITPVGQSDPTIVSAISGNPDSPILPTG